MRVHSIRLKMMLPILLLGIVLLGIFAFMQIMVKYEAKAMEKQTQSYFEAIAVVLNADRDIYQARLAQAEMLTDYGDKASQQKDFDENAKQVYDRFQKFREYLKDEPELLTPFQNFDQLYADWMKSSKNITTSYKAKLVVDNKLQALDKDFYTLRDMLDTIEAELRKEVTTWTDEQATQEHLQLYLNAIAKILNADRDMYQARLAEQKILAGLGDYAQNKKDFEENTLQTLNRFQGYLTLMENEPNFVQPYQRFIPLFAEWFKTSLSMLESDDVKQMTSHQDILAQADKNFSLIRDVLDQAGEMVRTHGREMEQEIAQDIAHYQKIAIVIIVAGFIAAFLMGYLIPKSITKNVTDISQRIKEISEGDGDLTARINSKSKDELGDLAHEFDGFLTKLQSIMRVIQDKSSALGSSTEQLDQVANTVNSITHVLVDSCNSIVSAASEMSMSNEQMSSVAHNTSSESGKAADHIEQGRGVVGSSHRTIDSLVDNIDITMTKAEELEKDSQSISSVLEVIRGIAEQTNLLALNAAIEAARAGEYGRGFAVVADEVRTLATQTGESTNQIETMINQLTDSVNEAFNAIKMSKNNATEAVSNFDSVIAVFDALNASFNTVHELSEQTAQATNEQSTVSQEISQNLVSMKEQTDGVDQASQEIRSQFNSLNALYQELDAQVSQFKV
ncbi:methyl-accepting chemotaxis protein [Vibrio nitrifigilis]|nr:methyl-accepting chemotaxis protein [Vibrio nitrifigilis]